MDRKGDLFWELVFTGVGISYLPDRAGTVIGVGFLYNGLLMEGIESILLLISLLRG